MGGRAGPVQEALGIISITTCVFLSSHLLVCLSVSIPLAKPISTWVNEAGQIGPPSHTTPTSSTPPIHSVPQRGHQKPMTRWVSNLRAARGPSRSLGPSTGAATDQGFGDGPGNGPRTPYPAQTRSRGWR